MAADIIQAQYEQLDQIAARFKTHSELQAALSQRVVQRVQSLQQGGWQGEGAKAFFNEMEGEIFPALQRLSQALETGATVTLEVKQIMQEAEEKAAEPFKEEGSPLDNLSGIASKILNTAADLLTLGKGVVGLIGLAGLRFGLGGTYAGQVLIKGSRAAKGLAGLSEALTHINAGNLPGHITKGALDDAFSVFNVVGAALQVGGQWIEDFKKYGDNPGQLVTALGVDAVLIGTLDIGGGIAGTAAGAKAGAIIGGALGSVIPGAGTAVGAAVGAAIGGIAGGVAADWLVDKYAIEPVLQSQWRTQLIQEGGKAIDSAVAQGSALFDKATQTVQNSLNAAASAIQNVRLPEMALP